MDSPQTPTVTARSSKEIPANKPRWAFSKGFFVGLAIEVPMFSLAVLVLAELGIGDPDVGFLRILWLTAVFTGIAAVFTAGGIGRLAASVTVERGRKRAIYVAARAHAMAGAGLLLIAVIPHGHLPADRAGFAVIAAAGLIPGALCGVTIGIACSSASPVGFAEVWSLAARPSGALRQLLDPRDLVKLGAALRTRTTNLFEGIFEPASRPPKQPGEPPKPEPPPRSEDAPPKRDA